MNNQINPDGYNLKNYIYLKNIVCSVKRKETNFFAVINFYISLIAYPNYL